jgi:hypothetical protein
MLLLYQLQALDSEIDHVRHQLAEIKTRLGESPELLAARTGFEAATGQFRQSQTALRNLELEVKGLEQKIAGQEQLLYSGKGVSAKEAANLQEEVASLKRWLKEREERMLEAMVEVETGEEALKAAETTAASVEAAWNAGQKVLLKTQTALKRKLLELAQRRPTMAEPITPADLSNYDRLRAKKAGRAVAAVKDGVCQGCGMTPSPSRLRQARAEDDLIYCGGCGRILYVS